LQCNARRSNEGTSMQTDTPTKPRTKPPTKPARPAPAPPADSALIDFEGIVKLAHPLGRRRVRHLKLHDTRFPPALFGGDERSRGIWSRRRIEAYLQRLADEGPEQPPAP
jgi:hypothetical protein